ncbi:MAG: CoA pyrophosphatase [Saprospiraceae bacterium]
MSLPFPLDASYIRQRLALGLPGKSAHLQLAVPNRWIPQIPPDDAKIAAVLMLIYPDDQGVQHMVFIERDNQSKGVHSGQISFPGGRVELGDNDLRHTALREAQEEVNVDPQRVEILGALSPLYIPVSYFLVHPILAFSTERPDFVAQETEVQNILEIPLMRFFEPDVRQLTDLKVANGMRLKDVPYFQIDDKVIWGATSMMLSELIMILQGEASN